MPGVERFKAAQDAPRGGFDSALRELRSGRKQGHWIWYVFPQLRGLGSSAPAETYGIRDAAEAAEYLADPLLLLRLLVVTNTVLEQLRRGVRLDHLMGSQIDVLKLVSSLTLFEHAAGQLYQSGGLDDYRLLAQAAGEVLDVAASVGLPRCAFTLDRLRG